MILSHIFDCVYGDGLLTEKATNTLRRRVLTKDPKGLSDIDLPPVPEGVRRMVRSSRPIHGTPYHLADVHDLEFLAPGERSKLREQLDAGTKANGDGSLIESRWYRSSSVTDVGDRFESVTRMTLLAREDARTRSVELPPVSPGCQRKIESDIRIEGTRLRYIVLEDRETFPKLPEAAQSEAAVVQASEPEPADDAAIHEALRKLGTAERAASVARQEFEALVQSRLKV